MLADLPQDVLILVFLHLLVEDVLALMQTCRLMHALGSLDYVWRALLSDWDVPLDIPPNTSVATLPSTLLRLAAVKSLRLDNRWRNPRLEMRYAQRVISQNSSFVDGMRLLPGGRLLLTVQYERTSRTHITLWSIADATDHNSIFRATVVGRARFLHAHHHHESEQVTIGVALTRGTSESIRVYNVSLQEDTSTRHALIFEATSDELHSMGRMAGMKINGEIMIAVFVPPLSQHRGQIVCVNLASRAAALLECPDWSFEWGRLKMFRRCFAVVNSHYTPQHTSVHVSFYELPSAILDSRTFSLPVPCWPEKQGVTASLISSTSWSSDNSQVFELSDDAPTNSGGASFTVFGYPVDPFRTHAQSLGVNIHHVSFDGKDIDCVLQVISCRSIPLVGEIRVSPSGRRAVWLHTNQGTRECILMKFALGRRAGNETGTCISTLMPSFSGFPFNPLDILCFVFDEISCKMAVGLPTGELYILHN